MSAAPTYAGEFEMHLTVALAGEAAIDAFRSWCEVRGFKCVRIVLSRGEHVEQPMATWRRAGTTLAAVTSEANGVARDATADGFEVTRVKVEAAPHNADVPVADEQAGEHDPRNYFEHHVKLLRPADADRGKLAAVGERHGAHLSRNAFRQPAEGFEERFVTLRSYGVGRETSDAALRELLGDLDRLGEHVLEHESEYCVYDSNLELDAGWLPEVLR